MEPKHSPLAVLLETLVWDLSAERLEPLEATFREVLQGSGRALPAVLAELADETLMVAVRKRFFRKEAFEECPVNRYERRLSYWFWRWTGDPERARELTQELYCKLLIENTQGSYNPARLFLPWLWKVARNLCVDQHRRQVPTRPLGLWEESCRRPSPEEEVIARELQGRVEAALLDLPEEQRRVLRGAMNGSDADQLVRETGLPKPKVYRLLFWARRHMERALRGDAGSRETRPERCVDVRPSSISGAQ